MTSSSAIALSFIIAILSGLLVGAFLPSVTWLYFSLVLLLGLVFSISYIRPRLVLVLFVMVGAFGLGWSRAHIVLMHELDQLKTWSSLKQLRLDGYIATTSSSEVLFIPDQSVHNFRLRLVVGHNLRVGDSVLVYGSTPKFSGQQTLTWFYPRVIIEQRASPWSVRQLAWTFRQWVLLRLQNNISQPASGLLASVVFGATELVSSETKSLFRQTGLSHVLAVSGYNMSLCLAVLPFLAQRFGRLRSQVITFFVVAMFYLMVGPSAAVTRALLMALLMLGAQVSGRVYHSELALLWSAALMLWWKPLLIIYDLGFQLSFLATAIIILYYRYRPRLLGWQNVWDGFMVSVFISLITAPLLLSVFSSVSLLGPVANILVLPVVPALMVSSVLVLIPGLPVLLAPILQAGISLLLTILNHLVMWSRGWALTTASFGGLRSFIVLAAVLLFGLFLLYFRRRFIYFSGLQANQPTGRQ